MTGVFGEKYHHRTLWQEVLMMPNIADIIRHHVSLEVRCIDRIYLHAYMPKLQTSGGLCYFLHDYLGHPVPSPALLKPRHDHFIAAVHTFAERHRIPLIPFERGESKDVRVATYRDRFTAREGVVIVGVAQEKMRSFKAHKRQGRGHTPVFDFSRQSVAVNHYYFYVQDRDWGPAFLKIGTYLPYPVKLCLNGHEWVKQRLRRDRIHFDSLDNGFLSCADSTALQAACDALGPADVQAFFDRWSHRLPWPMTVTERAAGYDHRLAICQLEVSLTQVFDRPVQGRHFFEAVIRDNLDLGRPDRVRLLFPLRLTRATPPPAFGYRTRVITDGVQPSLHVEYKSSHVKQYFKEQHALRTETTINNPMDFYVRKAVDNLSHLRELGHQVNRKLLEVERVSHHCVLTQEALDRLQRPTVEDGQRVSALRFGDPRVMALFQGLCAFTHLPRGFRNHDLRPSVEALLGRTYTTAQMTYDLRRLRLKGLIHRIPKTHRYTVTSYGLKVAFFYAKLYLRILRPNWAALLPDADSLPRSLRTVLNQLDAEIQKLHEEAALAA
ncbi:MAG TPA: hypothetical protein VEK56_16270 [Vicinamibacterales bacterium]|nr:hypothetical protein [Vicinamibacterales bacterium]